MFLQIRLSAAPGGANGRWFLFLVDHSVNWGACKAVLVLPVLETFLCNHKFSFLFSCN